MSVKFFIACINIITFCACVKCLVVYTKNGAVSGTAYSTSNGRVIGGFMGVPFAEPPVGKLRFKEPQPIKNWKGIRNADEYKSRCIQTYYYYEKADRVMGDDDCLYLNIFTPIISNNSNLDVIVYIHGGAFMFGAGLRYKPDYLLDDNTIVFVTINYRLGPFGFLTTEDGVIPGNNGLKDQVMALQWIQDNIDQFGGDKNKVTIMGMSAGGASVHLHYLSPMSNDLFSRGISVSGTAFCPWVLAENSRSKAQILASTVGCPTEDSEKMLDCLQKKPAKEILYQMEDVFFGWNFNPFSPFGPVIEPEGKFTFLSEHPYKLIKEGKVKDAPWFTTMTSEEGLYPAATFITRDHLLQELNDNWDKLAPHLLDYNYTAPLHQLNEISGKIRKYYLQDKTINKESIKDLVKMVSDRLFNAGIETAARLQASVTKSSVYHYIFAYRGENSASNLKCNCKDNFGVSHVDDMIYLVNPEYGFPPIKTEEDKAMVKKMVNIFTSFAKFAVPSADTDIKWPNLFHDIVNRGNLSYMLISSSQDIKPVSSEDVSNYKFWNNLPFEELWNINENKRQHYKKESKRQVDEL